MQTKHLCALIHIRTKGETGSDLGIMLTVPRRCLFWDFFCYLCFMFIFIMLSVSAAVWSPAVNRLSFCLSCVLCFCYFVTFL